MTPTAPRRGLAAVAGVSVLVGGLCFGGAVLATQGLWYAGYVSEAGVAGSPHRAAYRLGIAGLAVALLALAGAVRRTAALPALVLAASGVLAGVSGSVSCSRGCPLPPFEEPTVADLVHGGTSAAGVGLCGLAVLLFAFGPAGPEPAVRRLSRLLAGPVVAFGVLNVAGIAFVGRGHLTGLAERVLLVLIIVWCLAVSLARRGVAPRGARGDDVSARRPGSPAPPAARRSARPSAGAGTGPGRGTRR